MTTNTPPKGGLHIGLWVAQGLLAFAFGASGAMKLFTPHEALAAQMAWAADAPSFLPKFIGLSELLGAIGLILPSALRIQPRLTPLAAALLAVVMVLAIGTHVLYAEYMVVPQVILGAMAAFVAWGRTVAAPIPPK
jgi:uncharacterized membrane protein YphA (DoxX/SURF4 family)